MPIEDALCKRFEEAFCYSAALHAAQKRKGSEIPYIAHLTAVCALVLEQGGDEDQAIAALSEDAPFDSPSSPFADIHADGQFLRRPCAISGRLGKLRVV